MDDHISHAQLTRYVAGRCSAEEDAAIRRWIAADPERQAVVDALAQVWELGGLPLARWDARGAWAELVARREAQRYAIPRAAPSEVARTSGLGRWQAPAWSWPARIAAALVVAAGAAWLWWSAPAARRTPARQVAQVHEYVTRPGQRAELRLPDGTRVLLNVDSRIRVPTDFGRRARDLSLEGEALFEVQHDPDRAFRVTTARGVAEDLGTEFVVSAYPEDRDLRVAVTSGVVAFRPAATGADSGRVVELTRGDLGVLDAAGAVDVQRGIDLTPYIAWTEGRLVFEGVPLGHAVPQLERWYDADIRFADSALAARRLTATFHEEPLVRVLELLALSFTLDVERHGRTVVLRPKRDAHPR